MYRWMSSVKVLHQNGAIYFMMKYGQFNLYGTCSFHMTIFVNNYFAQNYAPTYFKFPVNELHIFCVKNLWSPLPLIYTHSFPFTKRIKKNMLTETVLPVQRKKKLTIAQTTREHEKVPQTTHCIICYDDMIWFVNL